MKICLGIIGCGLTFLFIGCCVFVTNPEGAEAFLTAGGGILSAGLIALACWAADHG